MDHVYGLLCCLICLEALRLVLRVAIVAAATMAIVGGTGIDAHAAMAGRRRSWPLVLAAYRGLAG